MRLLQGETLYARFERREKLEAGEAAEICKQLLAGVAALHAGGVIHRDLKPNNVILEPGSSGLHVSIMDFGLARPHEAANTLFGSGVIAGTPGYLRRTIAWRAPHQGQRFVRSGCGVHQVLNGERPTESEGGLALSPSPSLRATREPGVFVQAVEGFLSADPKPEYEPSSGHGPVRPVRQLSHLPLCGVAKLLPMPQPPWPRCFSPGSWSSKRHLRFPAHSSQPRSPRLRNLKKRRCSPMGRDFTLPAGERRRDGGGRRPCCADAYPRARHVVNRYLSRRRKGTRSKARRGGYAGPWHVVDNRDVGGTPRKLSDHLAGSAKWSPDGRFVMLADERTLYRIGADGENLTRIGRRRWS